MAIVNLSPESFYSSSFIHPDRLANQLNDFISEGADILDFGARSTAPWSKVISLEEEKERIKHALESIPEGIPKNTVISIDTQYREVAELAVKILEAKDRDRIIINDISSFTTDRGLMDFVIDRDLPVILMASHEVPGDARTIREIHDAFDKVLKALFKRNYDPNKVILDPGVGRWVSDKTYEYDLSILDNLSDFRAFGHPLLIGLSRKSFLKSILNTEKPEDRTMGSYAATAIAVYNGAHIVRTHDVCKDMVEVIRTASAIRQKPIFLRDQGEITACEYHHPFKFTRSAYHFLKDSYKVTPAGSRIMKNKMILRYIVLKNITAPQALILKQEMLARGGECAIDKDVITTEWSKNEENRNVVLIGTIKQLESLVDKLKTQSLKLQIIAKYIKRTLEIIEDPKLTYSVEFPEYYDR